MEKVFIRIVGEGGDGALDTDATSAMGRSVAQALQDDQEEDLELARDLAAVGFDEPRDCCGILTRFGHASLARYSCAMCCGTYQAVAYSRWRCERHEYRSQLGKSRIYWRCYLRFI